MRHHPIPRTVANDKDLTLLGTKYDSPSWFPNDVEGLNILHRYFHKALEDNGIPFSSQKFEGTQGEIISKIKEAYKGFDQKDKLVIPSTKQEIASNITISEAVEEQLKWEKEKRQNNYGKNK